MDYFAVGGRPLLSPYPSHFQAIQAIFNSARLEQEAPGQPAAKRAGGGAADATGAAGSGRASAATTADRGARPAASHDLLASQPDATAPMSGGVPRVRSLGSSAAASPRDGDLPGAVSSMFARAPTPLHTGFNPADVRTWDSDRFQMVRKLQDATRNKGCVHLMHDSRTGSNVAVKQMPNNWFRTSHREFVEEHPTETEMPWQDIGTVKFLNDAGFQYACDLLGVFRDTQWTYVVTTFASEGDLFSWCETGALPGLEREEAVLPLARQILEGVQQLHDMGIVHMDLSLENILMCKADDGALSIKIIDFGMASTMRHFQSCVRGKASYQAPELHTSHRYDAFLSDAFSLGVTLYAVLVKDYPWLSTRPGGCKCFEYVRKHGFRSYLDKRKLRNSQSRVGQIMSEPLKQLLEGLLALDPAERLTLGEISWEPSGAGRGSVWDEPWMQDGPGAA